MATQQLSDLDFNSASRCLNLPAPVNGGDAATKDYVDSAVEGISWKEAVRVASTANLNLSSPGSAIDGVTLSQDDRVLVKDQTSADGNGIYIFNGASSAMTRAPDADATEKLEQAVVTVEEGTANAATTWRQTEVNFALDTGDVTWSAFGTATPSASESTQGKAELATQAETDTGTDDQRIVTPLKLANWSKTKKIHSQQIGDGAATSLAVTHNLGTRNLIVQVQRVASPYDAIACDIEHTSVNQVTLKFAAAPTSNQFNVVIFG